MQKNMLKESDGKNMISEKKGLDDLPKVLILFLSSFLDLDGFLNFSSTNQKYRSCFSEFRMIYSFLNQIGFIKKFESKDSLSNRKQKLKTDLSKKKFDQLRDEKKNTPLHCALKNSSSSSSLTEIIKYLVENKSDLNSTNSRFDTPLHLACYNQQIKDEMIQYLIENKGDLNSHNVWKKEIYFLNEK